MRLLDAHLHLWDTRVMEYEWLRAPLDRPFEVSQLRGDDPLDVAECSSVFVQAETVPRHFEAEVAWVSGLARELDVRGIVAGARLDRGRATIDHLDRLAAYPLVVGVRHMLQGEPAGTSRSPSFTAGAAAVAERGWSFDACVSADRLTEVSRLADAVPGLRIVLDHLGKPPIADREGPLPPSAAWMRDLRDLASRDAVWCKLSGLPAENGGRWTQAQIEPFLDLALDAFGGDRLMFGSDWPVSAVVDGSFEAGSRRRWFQGVQTWARARGLDEDALFARNAERCYRLGGLGS